MATPDASKLIATYKFNGVELPKGLIPPSLHDVELSIWSAFWELSTERQSGMTEGRIRWSAIQSYSVTTGFSPSTFKKLIRAMDDVYLAHVSSKS